MKSNIGNYRALWNCYCPPSPSAFTWSLKAPNIALYGQGDYSTIPNNVALTGAGSFIVGANYHGKYTGVLSGAYSISIGGGALSKSGYLILTNNSTYSGGTSIQPSSNVVVGTGGVANSGLGTGSISIANGASLTYNFNGQSNTISNAISGSGSLILTGDGNPSNLNGSYLIGNFSAFTGIIQLKSARLVMVASQGNAQVNCPSGSALYLTGAFTANNPIQLSSMVWGADTTGLSLRLDGGATVAGTVTISGNVSIGSFTGGGTISGPIVGNGTVNFNNSSGTTLTLLNSGSSSGLNYICQSGNTVFSAGAFLTGITGQSVTVNSGATATLSGVSNTVYPVRPATVFNVNNGGTLAFSGANTKDGCSYLSTLNLTNTGSAAIVSSSDGSGFRGGYNVNTTITSSGTVANNISCGIWLVNGNGYTFTINNSNALNISGIITDFATLGGMPIIKNGSGNLTLSAANTNTGGVTLNAGTLTLTNTNAGGVTVASGAIISGGGVKTGTLSSLIMSATGSILNVTPLSTTTFSLLTCSSLTNVSGFTVAYSSGFTVVAGSYNILKITSTAAPTLGSIASSGLSNIGRTNATYSISGSAGAWFVTVTLN